jgi:hypothetical protein
VWYGLEPPKYSFSILMLVRQVNRSPRHVRLNVQESSPETVTLRLRLYEKRCFRPKTLLRGLGSISLSGSHTGSFKDNDASLLSQASVERGVGENPLTFAVRFSGRKRPSELQGFFQNRAHPNPSRGPAGYHRKVPVTHFLPIKKEA